MSMYRVVLQRSGVSAAYSNMWADPALTYVECATVLFSWNPGVFAASGRGPELRGGGVVILFETELAESNELEAQGELGVGDGRRQS
jgi:hypothetical protein